MWCDLVVHCTLLQGELSSRRWQMSHHQAYSVWLHSAVHKQGKQSAILITISPMTIGLHFNHWWHILASSDLAACYQLVQSVLNIGFALTKKGGIGGGGWAYSWHAVLMVAAVAVCRTALVGLAEPFLTLLAQMGAETTPLPCRGTISRSVGSFQSGGVFGGRRALTTASSLISGCG